MDVESDELGRRARARRGTRYHRVSDLLSVDMKYCSPVQYREQRRQIHPWMRFFVRGWLQLLGDWV